MRDNLPTAFWNHTLILLLVLFLSLSMFAIWTYGALDWGSFTTLEKGLWIVLVAFMWIPVWAVYHIASDWWRIYQNAKS